MNKQQAANKLEAGMRGLLARKHIKEGKASTEILRRYRVWDEVDGAARGWGAKGRRGSQERHTQFGNQALSLSDSRPCDSIWAIDWTTALNFKRSDGGRSSGVYLYARRRRCRLSSSLYS